MRDVDWPKVLRLIVVIATAILGTLTIEDGSIPESSPDTHTTTVVATPTPTPAAPAGELATRDPEQLRDETPADVPATTLQKAEGVEQDRSDALPSPADPLPVGGAQNYSCRTDYARRGFGARRPGAKVMSVKLHFTVSPNLPGWADVDGVGDYLERVGLSAHRIVDFEGHCETKVRRADNAYTQGAFNSTSYSYEIIATGRETRAQWLASPLIRKGILAAMVRDDLRRFGLPARRVDPVGCVDQLGVTDHLRLECGNDHVDVGPAFPWTTFLRQLSQGPDPALRARRLLHKETHARIASLCHATAAKHPAACRTLRARNLELHRQGI